MKQKKEIPSPCISVCTIEDDTGLCRGCFRSLSEITHWKALNEEQRTKIWNELEARRTQYGDSYSPYATAPSGQ